MDYSFLSEPSLIIEFNQRSENWCHERSASGVRSAIYLFDPVMAYRKIALARQNVQLKYEKPPVHCYCCPTSPASFNLHYLPATLRYCHVRHGSVLSLCVLLKLPWFRVSVTNVRAYFCEPLLFSYFLFFFGVFNVKLTFSSVNGVLGRRNTSFRFSFVREIPLK